MDTGPITPVLQGSLRDLVKSLSCLVLFLINRRGVSPCHWLVGSK